MPKLADAQLAIAREAGFPSWPRFIAFVGIEQQRAALGPLFPRCTEDLRRVLFFSRYQAAELGSPYIHPEHVLLALLQNNSLADQKVTRLEMLNRLPFDALWHQLQVAATGRPAIPLSQQIPFSDATKAVFVAADREAVGSGALTVSCGHVLVGLLRDGSALPAVILAGHGITIDDVRREIDQNPPGTSGAA